MARIGIAWSSHDMLEQSAAPRNMRPSKTCAFALLLLPASCASGLVAAGGEPVTARRYIDSPQFDAGAVAARTRDRIAEGLFDSYRVDLCIDDPLACEVPTFDALKDCSRPTGFSMTLSSESWPRLTLLCTPPLSARSYTTSGVIVRTGIRRLRYRPPTARGVDRSPHFLRSGARDDPQARRAASRARFV